MIFSDYQFPETHKFGTEIRKTLEKVIRDYFALYCWSNGIKAPVEGEPWGGLDEDHSNKFKKVIFHIVSEQPFTIDQEKTKKWGDISFCFTDNSFEDSDNHHVRIMKNSVIRLEENDSLASKYKIQKTLRQELIQDGVLVEYQSDGASEKGLRFTTDHEWNGSPSALTAFIYATSTSGPDYLDFGGWKFGNRKKVLETIKDGDDPEDDTFLGWLLHPKLARYGVIPEKSE